MTENITAQQALTNLDNFSKEWVSGGLENGIALPFRHWRNGHRKDFILLLLWKNVMVPFIFTVFVILSVKVEAWKLFTILLPCYVIYWIAFFVLKRREDASFILKTDGVMVVSPRDKVFFPWESIKRITSTEEEKTGSQRQTGYHRLEKVYATGYNLVIQVGNKNYVFYEIYPRRQVMDSDGRINCALMPLHIAYKVLKTACEKQKE